MYELKVVRERRTGYGAARRIATSRDIYEAFHERFERLDREEFLVIPLDGKNQVLGFHVVSVGTLTASLVHPRGRHDALMHPSDDPRDLTPLPHRRQLARVGLARLPGLIVEAGPRASRRFIEFFTANIRNRNTCEAYARAVVRFCDWCQARGLTLTRLEPILVAAYIEELGQTLAKPSVKQHLAAIRMLGDWLVLGQVIPTNPASSVRGPKYVVKRGKTPVLSAQETRTLLDAIDVSTLAGLRDRALIGVMVYSLARIGAVVAMRVQDYCPRGKRWWIRLHEKGGKHHEVPAHHNAEAYMDGYLQAAGIAGDKKSPLFRTVARSGALTERPMSRIDALKMVKRRARGARISTAISCHTFRATGITAYLENGGTIENAQAIAAHESPRTTKLYDRTSDQITLDEVERIAI